MSKFIEFSFYFFLICLIGDRASSLERCLFWFKILGFVAIEKEIYLQVFLVCVGRWRFGLAMLVHGCLIPMKKLGVGKN